MFIYLHQKSTFIYFLKIQKQNYLKYLNEYSTTEKSEWDLVITVLNLENKLIKSK